MLATFCLRLACGLMGCLLLLRPDRVNPRFFRMQFLIVLGLTVSAAAAERDKAEWGLWVGLITTAIFALLGSIVWSLETVPGGRIIMLLSSVSLLATLAIEELGESSN